MSNRRRCIYILSLLLLVIGGALWYWAHSAMPTYTGLDKSFKIARVCVSQTRTPFDMNVHVILFDSSGREISDHIYNHVNGDTLLLEGDIIRYTDALNVVDLHSGYKLTQIEGYYNNPSYENRYKPQPIFINKEDSFFTTIQEHPTSVIEATHDRPFYVQADGTPYDILASQRGLSATKASDKRVCEFGSKSVG